VEAVVTQGLQAAGFGGEWAAFGWVGCDTRDCEVAQEAVDCGIEPACVARFEDGDLFGREFAIGGEELVNEAFVEGLFGWELDEDRAQFFAEAADLVEEGLNGCAGVDELGLVRDLLRHLHGEAEVFWRGGGPALPGFQHVRAVEAGVDFNAGETGCVAFEVGTFCRKVVRVLFGERPAGGADADCRGWRCGAFARHGVWDAFVSSYEVR